MISCFHMIPKDLAQYLLNKTHRNDKDFTHLRVWNNFKFVVKGLWSIAQRGGFASIMKTCFVFAPFRLL